MNSTTALAQAGDKNGYTLTRRRVYILPTRHGYGFGLTLFLMFIGAVNYNNGLGYALIFLLVSMCLVSLLHTYQNLAGLRIRSGLAEPVFAGETAYAQIVVDNRDFARRFGLLLRYDVPGTRRKADQRVRPIDIEANSLSRQSVALPTARRGWLRLKRITLATRYPFGLFRAWSYVPVDLRCLVYPQPRGRKQLPENTTASLRDSGSGGSGRDDFSGFREYVPGDSPRHIHWKVAARGNTIPVKQFSGASAGELVIHWSDVASDDIEARLAQLCLWVVEAEEAGMRYGLSIPGVELAPDNGEVHRHACLRALAQFGET